MVDMKKYGKDGTQARVLRAVAAALEGHPDLTIPLSDDKVISNEDAVAYLRERAQKLDEKNAGKSGKLTPRQQENEVIKGRLLAFLHAQTAEDADFKATVTQLFKELNKPENGGLPEDMTTNRMSAIIQQMYLHDPTDTTMPIRRVEVKRVAYFLLNPDYKAPEAEVEVNKD